MLEFLISILQVAPFDVKERQNIPLVLDVYTNAEDIQYIPASEDRKNLRRDIYNVQQDFAKSFKEYKNNHSLSY